jgi:hypothetical protein
LACAVHRCLRDGIPGLRLPGSADYPRFRPLRASREPGGYAVTPAPGGRGLHPHGKLSYEVNLHLAVCPEVNTSFRPTDRTHRCGEYPWPQNSVKFPHHNPFGRGQGHSTAAFFLPTRRIRSRVALHHVACHWVPARSDYPTRDSSPQAPAFHRAHTVCGPNEKTPLCPM